MSSLFEGDLQMAGASVGYEGCISLQRGQLLSSGLNMLLGEELVVFVVPVGHILVFRKIINNLKEKSYQVLYILSGVGVLTLLCGLYCFDVALWPNCFDVALWPNHLTLLCGLTVLTLLYGLTVLTLLCGLTI